MGKIGPESARATSRRRAKIAATLGPACEDPRVLEQMIAAGLDVARVNYSHGDPGEHERRVRGLARACKRARREVGLMADLQGPRLRLGDLPGGSTTLRAGQVIELLAGRQRCGAGAIPVTYPALAADVARNSRILIDDGNVELRVERVRGGSVRALVVRGGEVSDHKGINLPDARMSARALTTKDRRDLEHAVARLGADWLAISFVRSASDVRLARKLAERAGRRVPIMAKIERAEAVEQLPEILAAADGLLVARGDLGVELPPHEVPMLQKRIIEAANAAGKPVVTATQMLESMRKASRPTRAEASDVANAVLDGSDALLLTAETAAGAYPVEAVRVMSRIIEHAEISGRVLRPPIPEHGLPVAVATCLAGCRTAYQVGARYLVVFTQSGFSALQVARFRPSTPILAFAASAEVARQLRVVWGIRPRVLPSYETIERMMREVDRALMAEGLVEPDELIVLLAGSPVGVSGGTNLMNVHGAGQPMLAPRGPR